LHVLELGREVVVEALGKKWTIGRLTLRIVKEFKHYLEELVGDPYAQIDDKHFDLLPKEEQLALLKEAKQAKDDLACFSLNCPLAKKYLAREEGVARFGQLMLQQSHPDITPEDAFDVWMAVGQEEMQKALQKAQGSLPNAEAAA